MAGVLPLVILLRGDLRVKVVVGTHRARIQVPPCAPLQVGGEEPVDSGLLPGLLPPGEERGMWLRLRLSEVLRPPHPSTILPL